MITVLQAMCSPHLTSLLCTDPAMPEPAATTCQTPTSPPLPPNPAAVDGSDGAAAARVHTFHLNPHQPARLPPQVVFLLRLLELAMQSRQQLREHTFFLPEADEGLLLELLPWLGSLLVEAQLRGDSDRPGGGRLARWDCLAAGFGWLWVWK